MDMRTKAGRDALRALAGEAQAGPWRANGPDVDMTGGRCAIVARPLPAPVSDDGTEPEDFTTARYLAALPPDVLLALLDHIDALEAERDALHEKAGYALHSLRALLDGESATVVDRGRYWMLCEALRVDERRAVAP